jgi:hypothetical protein
MLSSQEDWPVQQRPHGKVWSLWRKALSDSFCSTEHRYVLASRPGQLKQPLGASLHSSQTAQSPPWNIFSYSRQHLFLPSSNEPGCYHQLSTEMRLNFSMAKFDLIIPRIRSPQLPEDAVPAQPHSDGTFERISIPNTLGSPSQPNPITTFQAYLEGLPSWQTDLLQGVFQTLGTDTLNQHLLNGDHLLFCSDGGAIRQQRVFWMGHRCHIQILMEVQWHRNWVVCKLVPLGRNRTAHSHSFPQRLHYILPTRQPFGPTRSTGFRTMAPNSDGQSRYHCTHQNRTRHQDRQRRASTRI